MSMDDAARMMQFATHAVLEPVLPKMPWEVGGIVALALGEAEPLACYQHAMRVTGVTEAIEVKDQLPRSVAWQRGDASSKQSHSVLTARTSTLLQGGWPSPN